MNELRLVAGYHTHHCQSLRLCKRYNLKKLHPNPMKAESDPVYKTLKKPPTVLFQLAIFGLNEFSTRFVSALLGSLTVLLVFFPYKKTAQL